MSNSGSHGTLTVWLAKSEKTAINPTTHEAAAVVALVVVPLVVATVVAIVVAVVVGKGVVGLAAAGEFQLEVIGICSQKLRGIIHRGFPNTSFILFWCS